MKVHIKTTKRAIPMVYAYSTPQIAEHNGWTKIGYTETQTVEDRIKQQTHTANVTTKLEWKLSAFYEDGTGDRFTDKDFHAYLRKCNIPNTRGTEWFKISGPDGKRKFQEFRENRGLLKATDVVQYQLRAEQEEAVRLTKAYYEANEEGEFLWNAKPRFGKTLSVYDFCKQVKAKKVLIVTNRPAIANSWYSDYAKFLGEPSGYKFVSETDALKGEPFVYTRQQYLDSVGKGTPTTGYIEFLSLQDLKGSIYFGGTFNKLKEIQELEWDVLVIDEAHEGIDTMKTDIAFERIRRRFTLHLSGTPFKALANNKFPDNAIYNWTYADEQKAKRDWNSPEGENNPYATLPQLNLFTYQMSEIVRDELERGVEIEGETEEYAFDLNEFFETKNGKFVHDASVSKFLDALTKQEKFPFSTEELRNELKHTFWFLNRVESAKALSQKLKEHPVFSQYEIVVAAGDGKQDEGETAEGSKKAYDKVKEAIKNHDKTITLSVGQLTTGITIPEWTAVLMLCNLHSPALYMQAAFRAQNPHMFFDGKTYQRKENAYVFDFDPARTLTIFEEFANDLSLATANGGGDTETRKKNIRELLNFFPVIGEDEKGEMIELDAEKVLSIPRKIRSQEVVRRGFMSNYLFQNISGIFNAPPEVVEIISSFEPIKEPKKTGKVNLDGAGDLDINPVTGEIDPPNEKIIGKTREVFGDKIYGKEEQDNVVIIVEQTTEQNVSNKDAAKKVVEVATRETVTPIITSLKTAYKDDIKKFDETRVKKVVETKVTNAVNKAYVNHGIEQKKAEQDHLSELQNRDKTGKTEAQIQAEFAAKQQELNKQLKEKVAEAVKAAVEESQVEAVRTVEASVQERKKEGIEESVRDHLRGFSRTIPSFLMAYGDDQTTLKTFDTVVPDKVFKEVTSITLNQFRFLRDGGEYTTDQGEKKQFRGNLFDPVVFDDSVKEFLRLKQKLADYFNEKNEEDIFDYIPSQKTNQIFTPKVTVKKMVDMLEQENPGCFDDPEKTFIDLYMKSGLYVTEIVKRLYSSDHMKEVFPDSKERLQHIFAKQVYGLAPTEIIYKISLAYILGFDETNGIRHHNFKLADALPYAKNGTLEAFVNRLFSSEAPQS